MDVQKPVQQHFQTGPQRHMNTTTKYTKNHVLLVHIHLHLASSTYIKKNVSASVCGSCNPSEKRLKFWS